MKDTQYFKDLLEKEASELLRQLKTLGRVNPDNADDWETVKKDGNNGADELDVAESIEEFEDNNAVLENLETRLHEVKHAIQKIDNGNYGVCDVCGQKIEEDRLEANPAAATCKTHM